MTARTDFLKAAVESFAAGAAAGLVVNAVWFAATGETPSLLTTVIGAQVVTCLWGGMQALRFRRKWQRVLASYNQPALGQGIEIPHRPPADGPEYLGHVVDYAADGGAPECVEDCPGCESKEAGR
ncbi:hypothetical protein [Streptomyces sp. NPDC058812]|uniref:hypothetical protein n=1 Tax=unclassified Streptomyces TaxID=2593676 RepID=UPI00369B62AC